MQTPKVSSSAAVQVDKQNISFNIPNGLAQYFNARDEYEKGTKIVHLA